MLVDQHYKYKKHIQRLNSALRGLLDLYESDDVTFCPHHLDKTARLEEELTVAKARASLKMTEKHHKEQTQ